jgi:hypothetical protein
MGVGPFGGEASSSFGTVAPQLGADFDAHGLLVAAWLAVASTNPDGYAELTPGAIKGVDPTLDVVGDAPAQVGRVSVNMAGPDGLVFSTKSRSGMVFCLAVGGDGIPRTGSVDAHNATSVDDCSGKAWAPGE